MASERDACMYCEKDQRLLALMIPICHLEVSTLYLFREQTYSGRCVVALDRHETELFRLDPDTLSRFSRDVARAAAAVHAAFRADKINYAIYGDLVSHLHYHIVPKHKSGHGWGEPFTLQTPNPRYLTEAGYQDMSATIAEHLSAS